MPSLAEIDWQQMLVPTLHPLETVLRGTAVYLFLFFLLRMIRRGAGAIGVSDVLVVVLIADAAQNAMANEYKSIADGLILVSTIVGLDYLLDWLSFRSPWMRKLLQPAPLALVLDGRIQRRNLRAQLLTTEDLMGQLREHGVNNVADVHACYLEADCHVSVVTRDRVADDADPKSSTAPV